MQTPKLRRTLIYILSCMLAILIGLNLLLAFVDPLGVLAYMDTIQAHTTIWQSHPTGFQFPPDDYDFPTYPVRMRRDGYRDVPMSVYADCVVTFVGDSFTYGSGVSDWQTFVSLLAARFDTVEFHNAGRGGYNVENVARTIDYIDDSSDGFVYLIYDNDHFPTSEYAPAQRRWMLPLAWYIYAYAGRLDPNYPPYIESDFEPLLAPILARDNLIAFIFEDAPMAETSVRHGAIVIPRYTGHISAYDFHPNTVGHEEIADAMHPYLVAFTEGLCE